MEGVPPRRDVFAERGRGVGGFIVCEICVQGGQEESEGKIVSVPIEG